MSNQLTHPNIDPLGLRGKRIGHHPDERFRYNIESFSYPATFDIYDEESDTKKLKVGYVVIYQVKFNFENSGRKAVSHRINSTDLDSSQHNTDGIRKMVVTFLEDHAERILADTGYDKVLPWEDKNSADPQ